MLLTLRTGVEKTTNFIQLQINPINKPCRRGTKAGRNFQRCIPSFTGNRLKVKVNEIGKQSVNINNLVNIVADKKNSASHGDLTSSGIEPLVAQRVKKQT